MIQDEDSKLIPLLISENDFSSDWRWYSILIKQETVVPTPENSDLVEQAVVNYGGYFQNEDVLVSIWETVERYKTFPPTIDPDNINLGVNSKRIVSTFYPDIEGGDTTKCVHHNAGIECALLKKQDDILFTLEFSIPVDLGEEQMQIWLTQYAKLLSKTK